MDPVIKRASPATDRRPSEATLNVALRILAYAFADGREAFTAAALAELEKEAVDLAVELETAMDERIAAALRDLAFAGSEAKG